MNHKVFVAGLLALAGTSFGSALEIGVDVSTRVDEASFASLQTSLGTALTGIDLSAQPYTALLGGSSLSDTGGGQDNFLTGSFSNLSYTGTLTSEVFANQGTTGPGVSDVVIRYTFTNTGGSLTPIDTFNYGINDGTVLDFADLAASTHGRISDVSSPGVATPVVTLDDSGNTTLDFNFNADMLQPGETFTWYVAGAGDVKVNLVDVTISDFQGATTQALAFTTTGGQNDLDFPAPGGIAAFAGCGILGLRRRRR